MFEFETTPDWDIYFLAKVIGIQCQKSKLMLIAIDGSIWDTFLLRAKYCLMAKNRIDYRLIPTENTENVLNEKKYFLNCLMVA